SPLSRADSAERIRVLMASCGEGESASRVPAGRFCAAAEVASRSANAVRLSENFCIRWLDPPPPSKVCKVFQKKDLGVDFSVHVKHGSPALDDRASGSLSSFNDNSDVKL